MDTRSKLVVRFSFFRQLSATCSASALHLASGLRNPRPKTMAPVRLHTTCIALVEVKESLLDA